MSNEDEIGKISNQLVNYYVEVHKPDFFKTHTDALKNEEDHAELSRIQLKFVHEVDSLRKSGYIPSLEEIELTAKSIFNSGKIDSELKKYKEGLVQYENELKKV